MTSKNERRQYIISSLIVPHTLFIILHKLIWPELLFLPSYKCVTPLADLVTYKDYLACMNTYPIYRSASLLECVLISLAILAFYYSFHPPVASAGHI
jgi:hypothetical protein